MRKRASLPHGLMELDDHAEVIAIWLVGLIKSAPTTDRVRNGLTNPVLRLLRIDTGLVIDAAIDGNSDIYLVSIDSWVSIRPTSETVYDGLPEWSADGRWIYFTSLRSGRPELWKVSVDGGEPMQLTQGGCVQPRQSADGQRIFYLDRPPYGTAYGSSTSRLMSIPAAGGDESPLTDGIRIHLWSPVPDGIVFVSLEPDADALDLYRFSDGRVQRLGTLPFRVSRIAELGGLTVSRNGGWALVSTTDVWESDVMVASGVW